MKPYLTIIIAISTLLLFVQCKKEVEFKGKNMKPKIVLNSIIYTDSIIECYVHKSNSVASGIFTVQPLTNATVVLSENGVVVETMTHVSNGKYLSNTTASAGKIYKIHVSLNNYDDAIGTSQIVYKPEWIKIDSIGVVTSYQDNQGMIMFRLKMPKESATNYYAMTIYEKLLIHIYDEETHEIIDSTFQYFHMLADMDYARGIEFSRYHYDGETGYEKYFLTDKITSQENEGIIDFPIRNSIEQRNRTLLFVIEKISEDLFMYEHSLYMLDDYYDFPLFSQPVQTYMNIEGGLGFIGTSVIIPVYYYQ